MNPLSVSTVTPTELDSSVGHILPLTFRFTPNKQAGGRLVTCPGDCWDRFQHPEKMYQIREETTKINSFITGSAPRDQSLVFIVSFWLVKSGPKSLTATVTVLQFSSCTINPHLNITITIKADLIIHLPVEGVKVPDHLKLRLHFLPPPPLDGRRTNQTDINKYIREI